MKQSLHCYVKLSDGGGGWGEKVFLSHHRNTVTSGVQTFLMLYFCSSSIEFNSNYNTVKEKLCVCRKQM